MNKTIFTAAVLLVLAGCNDDKEQTKPAPGEGKITVTAGIDALTRAPHLNEDGSGYFQDGDKIALTVSGGDKTVRKEYTIGGAALYWEDLGLPSGTTEASFAGCYPAPESAEGSEFTFDLSTAADKDLLLAPAMKVSKSADTKVNLAFKHAMHKLAINYASDGTYTQEQLEAVKTTCTAKSSCEVDMAAATVSKTADKTAAFEAAGKAVRFLLVPQTSEEVTLKIEIGGKTVEHTLAGLNEVLKNATQEIPAALDGGKCLTLNLTFGKDGIAWKAPRSAAGKIREPSTGISPCNGQESDRRIQTGGPEVKFRPRLFVELFLTEKCRFEKIVNFGFIGFKRIRQIAIRTVQPLRTAVFRKCGEKIGYGKIIPKFYENPDF